ncbi:MAG: hypothetical protein AAF787_07120 [Chloroflexota bacterium]
MSEPLITRRGTPRTNPTGVWLMRLFLAACLFFGSEVLVWTDIARPVWLLLAGIPGYVALAALLLDLAVRFKVRDIFGVLTLAGVYALCAASFIHPAATLNALPTSLITRVMGAQVLAGAFGLGVFLALLDSVPYRRLFLLLSLVSGFFWGVWARGYPTVVDLPVIGLVPTLSAAVTVGVIVTALCGAALRATDVTGDALRLTRIEWGIVLLVLATLLVFWIVRGAISRGAASAVITLLFYCVMILWFQDRPEARHLFVGRLPAGAPPNLAMAAVGLLIFVGVGAAAYQLPVPSGDGTGVLSALLAFVGVLGLAWLPAVSVVLGVRAYRFTVRTGKSL